MRGAKQKEMFEISDLRRRVRSVCPFIWGGGGGGGTLAIFWGFKILNFNLFFYFFFWGGGGGSDDFVDIFGGSSQNWTIFRGYFYFRDFSEGQGTDRRIFWGLLKLQIIIWGA